MSVLVFLEHHEGELQKGALGVLTKAGQLGDGDVAGVVIGSGVRELAAEVRSLLAAHKPEDGFLEQPAWAVAPTLAFDEPRLHGVYVLGAPEVLQPYLHAGSEVGSKVDEWTARGLRVLLFAYLVRGIASRTPRL